MGLSLDSIVSAAIAFDHAAVEIIVVDNGSTDETAAVVAQWKEDSSVAIVPLFLERPGVSAAKNVGIAASSGRILCFTDDDCLMEQSYFVNLMRFDKRQQPPAVRGGRVELGNASDLPFTIKTVDHYEVYEEPLHPGGFLHGCNLTVPRDIVEKIGGFDEEFGPAARYKAAEDTEFLFRAHQAGYDIHYHPELVVFHHHGRRDLKEIERLNRQYQFGNGALIRKYMFSNLLLAKHWVWALRNGVKEWFGGNIFDSELSLSHWDLVFSQLRGFIAYRSSRAK